VNTSYSFPSDVSNVRLAFRVAQMEVLADRHPVLVRRPRQWANALMMLAPSDRTVLTFRLLDGCPNSTWIDRGVDAAIAKLQSLTYFTMVEYSGMVIRNLYYLHSAKSSGRGDFMSEEELEHYYRVLTFLAFLDVTWSYLTTHQDPSYGPAVHFGDSL